MGQQSVMGNTIMILLEYIPLRNMPCCEIYKLCVVMVSVLPTRIICRVLTLRKVKVKKGYEPRTLLFWPQQAPPYNWPLRVYLLHNMILSPLLS